MINADDGDRNKGNKGNIEMSDYQSQINRLVEEFVSQITTLARQAASDTLATALGRSGIAAATPKGAKGAKGAKGEKRAQNEIERTKLRVHDFIRQHPGLRIEQINKELGTTTRDLVLPLKKLIADGGVRTEGKKRSTQYFPGDGKSREGNAKRRKKAIAKKKA
jgi:hypothetical protein